MINFPKSLKIQSHVVDIVLISRAYTMRFRTQYESEDSSSEDDDSSSVDSFEDSDSEEDLDSEDDSESDQEDYGVSRIRSRGRSSSRRSSRDFGDYTDDSDDEEGSVVCRPSMSPDIYYSSRNTSSTSAQRGSLAPDFTDTANYFANSQCNHYRDHSNTIPRTPHLRLNDRYREDEWRDMDRVWRENPILRELEGDYNMNQRRGGNQRQRDISRERSRRAYVERQRERGRYRRNSSSDLERDFRDYDYVEETRPSGGFLRGLASGLMRSLSGG